MRRWLQDILKQWGEWFVQGLLLIAPVAITIAVIVWLIGTLDEVVQTFIPEEMYFPGIGVVLTFLLITLVGAFSRLLVVHGALAFLDRFLVQLPGVGILYTAVKEIFQTIRQHASHLGRPVLVQMDREGKLWKPGLLIENQAPYPLDQQLSPRDYVVVYLPHSYNFSGNMFLVKKEWVRPISDTTAVQYLKFIASAGLIAPSEAEAEHLSAQTVLARIHPARKHIVILEGSDQMVQQLRDRLAEHVSWTISEHVEERSSVAESVPSSEASVHEH